MTPEILVNLDALSELDFRATCTFSSYRHLRSWKSFWVKRKVPNPDCSNDAEWVLAEGLCHVHMSLLCSGHKEAVVSGQVLMECQGRLRPVQVISVEWI